MDDNTGMNNPIFNIIQNPNPQNNNNNQINDMYDNPIFRILQNPIIQNNINNPLNMNNNQNNIRMNQDMNEKLEISPADIYNINEANNIKELLICPICLNILISPVQCNKCNKCFCKSCIDIYRDSNTKCPFRCVNPLYLENKFVNNVLSILKFKCKNRCGKIINYEDLEKHYEEECEKIDFKTKYKELLKKYKELKMQMQTQLNPVLPINPMQPINPMMHPLNRAMQPLNPAIQPLNLMILSSNQMIRHNNNN